MQRIKNAFKGEIKFLLRNENSHLCQNIHQFYLQNISLFLYSIEETLSTLPGDGTEVGGRILNARAEYKITH